MHLVPGFLKRTKSRFSEDVKQGRKSVQGIEGLERILRHEIGQVEKRVKTLEHEALYRKGNMNDTPTTDAPEIPATDLDTKLDALEAKVAALEADFDAVLSLHKTYQNTSAFYRELAALIEARKTAVQVPDVALIPSDAPASVETLTPDAEPEAGSKTEGT